MENASGTIVDYSVTSAQPKDSVFVETSGGTHDLTERRYHSAGQGAGRGPGRRHRRGEGRHRPLRPRHERVVSARRDPARLRGGLEPPSIRGPGALGGPEAGLISLGAAQLARYYGLPSRGTGGNTDAPALDHQAGAESATTLLLSALAGFDIIYDVTGSLESSLSASYAKLILDSDLAGAVKRITSGIEVSEETLATGVIEAAGPKGSYPFQPHTIDHFRRTPLLPDTFLRSGRASAGSLALAESAQARAETILAGHIVDPPLQPATETKLNAFLKKALKRPAPAASVAA